ncbi:MAG: AAA family ATPase [Deltaproteobacteria bacterium]|nr:AAA family ATPase [Deltaproteobacteria bacterium]
MYRKEVNTHSPLRVLERSIHGGLGPGNLGVVMARAGTGKTAFLVQIALDDLMRERSVLHVSLEQNIDHVQCWYDGLFDDMARRTNLAEPEAVRRSIQNSRVIHAFPRGRMSAEDLERIAKRYEDHLSFRPSAIIVDGFNWEGPMATTSAELGAIKALAKRFDAELWMGAQTHREVTSIHPTRITAPCSPFESLIDVALFLEPHEDQVTVRLLKDHGKPVVDETRLFLNPDTLALIEASEEQPTAPHRLGPTAYTLLSGGAQGAESEFGMWAERYKVQEMTFSFAGRAPHRKRGVVELDEETLRLGAVSPAYVDAQLHRKFPRTETFQRMLQTIWHQVSSAGEVFVVGHIMGDGTVRGGTGWAAELARHFKKPVHVFDQETHQWMSWQGEAWKPIEPPRIRRTRFTGTGTRFLTDEGREAVRTLFLRTFGER